MSKWVRGLAGGWLLALLAGCNSTSPSTTCTAENCTGCCAGDTCVAGDVSDACGGGGVVCEACGAGQECQNKTCRAACSAASCPDGCCNGTTCELGVLRETCGKGGAACMSCEGGSCVDHECKGGTACSASNPSGQCPSGQTCTGGTCKPSNTCDAKSCAGCCAGGVCQPGNTTNYCGISGNACATCPDAQTCLGGLCQAAATGCGNVPVEGRCVSTSTVEFCSVTTGSSLPQIKTRLCDSSEKCVMAGGKAVCQLSSTCRNGQTRCDGASKLLECRNGSWVSLSCPGGCNGTNPVSAFCTPQIPLRTLKATLKYEVRLPNSARTDWGPLQAVPAGDFLLISVADSGTGSAVPVDAVLTSADGQFQIKLPSTSRPNDGLLAIALGVAPGGTGTIRWAVADPDVAVGEQPAGVPSGPNPRWWAWGWPASDLPTDGMTLTMLDAQMSGAAHVAVNLSRVFREVDRQYPGQPAKSVVVWMHKGTTWNCGACFGNWQSSAVGGIRFDSQVFLGVHAVDQQYWSDTVIAHELGHWAMDAFGKSPNEGGSHFIGVPVPPGMAWSEGWATWFSAAVRNDSIYFVKQDGGAFWLDLNTKQYSYPGLAWVRPTPSKGLLQFLDENEVSSQLWKMSSSSAQSRTMLFASLTSSRMTTSPWPRGYTRHTWREWDKTTTPWSPKQYEDTHQSAPAFPDFLDALNCAGMARSVIDSATNPTTAYPYPSSSPLCAQTCSTSCAGCCAGSSCQPGTSTSACGANGTACMTCNAGQTCTNGVCTGGSCSPANCASGCCTGTTCLMPSDTSCGLGGAICATCSGGKRCDAGTCRSPEGGGCSTSVDCMTGLLCSEEPSTHVKKCFRGCTPPSSTCGAGFNCVSLSGQGLCVPAPTADSRWKLTIQRATLRPGDPADGGAAWDGDGSAADPRCCANIAGTSVCTPEASNTNTPVWNYVSPVSFAWKDLASVTLTLSDVDLLSDDFVDSYTANLQSTWAGQTRYFTLDHSSDPTAGSTQLFVACTPE